MQLRSSLCLAVAFVGATFLAPGCGGSIAPVTGDGGMGSGSSSGTASSSGSTTAARPSRSSFANPARRVSLQGMSVELSLPSGWAPRDEDPEHTGFAAFAESGFVIGIKEQERSAFVDGSPRGAALPASLDAAEAQTRGSYDCGSPAPCTVLRRERLAGGGYVVALKTRDAVEVAAFLPGTFGRAVRCGAEVSALGAIHAHPHTWLEDPNAVAKAQLEAEAICRSVKIVP